MKKLLKLFTSSLLILSMLTPGLSAFAAESDGMQPLDNLIGMSGNWKIEGDKADCNGGGDMFALSDTRTTAFVFEADVEFVNHSGAASLVFLSSDNPARGSYVANIDLTAGNARIFRFEAAGGATTKGEYRLTDGQKAQSKFHLRVEVEGASMVYFLDGTPIISITDDSQKHGDRLGLLDWNTSLKYTNIRWADLSAGAPELTALTGLSTPFTGQTNLRETLPFGTKELKLTATAKNGSLAASAEGAKVTVSGKSITVSEIKDSFDLVITVSKGSIVRSYVVAVKVEPDPATVYNEAARPQLHFSPYVNWLNDPNGLVYDPSDKSWHLFFQYNPYGLNIANQVWGHAVSTDLMHWKEVDIAIPQDSFGAVFSGSAVVDEDNTSGFFTDNKPGESKLVALYTSDGGDTTHGVEKQCIAYSKDHGVTWIKPDLGIYDKNIVISNANHIYGRDFRDPKIFRYDGKWFMVIAGGRARLFVSDDLKNWTFACDMGFDSECPDFYPLPVDGEPDNVKWVYTASGKWYTVGRLEKISDTQYKFVEETARITYNGGQQVYATQSFYNDGTGANRRIAISWIQDHSAGSVAGKTWNGAMTLPHEQTLRTVNGKIILTSDVVAEVDSLRGSQVIDLNNPTVEAADEALSKNPGKVYDLETIFKPEAGSVTTFTLRQNATLKVEVIYDSTANRLRVIRGRASSATGNIPAETMEMPLYPDKDGNVTIRIVMDTTAIEVFGNDGEAACTGLIFPDADCINSSLSVSGNVEILSMKMWRMTSIWHKGEEVTPDAGIYFDVTGSVALNEESTIYAYTINDKGERVDSDITWVDVDATLATVISKEGGKLVIRGIREGNLILTAKAGDQSKQLILKVAKVGFTTNLENWTSSGDWYESDKGWSLGGSEGDSFSFSSTTHSGAFTYTGVANFEGKPGCLGLVFGATNPENPKSGTWYGANVDTHGSQTMMKLFCNTKGNQTWFEEVPVEGDIDLTKLTLTVRYDGKDTITYTVGDSTVTHQVRNLEGTFGLVSWNGGGSFNQLTYTDGNTPPVTEEPPVTTPPATEEPPVTQEKPPVAEPETPDTPAEPGDSPKQPEAEASPLPFILIGAGALLVAGIVTAILLGKKKKH